MNCIYYSAKYKKIILLLN